MVSLAHDVENAVANGDPAARRIMLLRMTDLFVDNADRLRDDQVSTFDTVILKLARSVESAARAALSERLSDIANAPRTVVLDLANDADVSVAGPVLSRSVQVAEGELLRIAAERGQGHLQALSRRRSLSERVTDVLVARGDTEVLRTVAGNAGARLSPKGFDTLAVRAEADDALKAALTLRRDIPAHHMAHLVETARSRVTRKLGSEFGNEVAAMAVSRAARTLGGPSLSLQEAAVIVDAALRAGGADQPEEGELIAWLAEGRVMEALVGLARAAAMPPEMVLRAYQGAHSDPLLFLIRSLRYGWGTFKAFLQSKTDAEPSPEEWRGLFEAFQALSVTTAQRVVRFTAARDQLQKAG
ncbi:hypothetical protein MHA02_18720 [Methylobacterium haplocladii]|uniref:DUF2336 domain-containing protein n=2 Tax=Methylobacterium haplocladii TaxID=1176176 RepID=A0A512IP54_9HYPH|nr:hypothetical protein MHA02_18720 [Methylobacterium haplocladii]